MMARMAADEALVRWAAAVLPAPKGHSAPCATPSGRPRKSIPPGGRCGGILCPMRPHEATGDTTGSDLRADAPSGPAPGSPAHRARAGNHGAAVPSDAKTWRGVTMRSDNMLGTPEGVRLDPRRVVGSSSATSTPPLEVPPFLLQSVPLFDSPSYFQFDPFRTGYRGQPLVVSDTPNSPTDRWTNQLKLAAFSAISALHQYGLTCTL